MELREYKTDHGHWTTLLVVAVAIWAVVTFAAAKISRAVI